MSSSTVDAGPLERARALGDRLAPQRAELVGHPVHRAITDRRRLARFAEWHVFAVWDFMQLLKSLQARLAPARIPWTPGRDRAATRFVNELVLGEESDDDPRGGSISHFDLYREGMEEIGAASDPMDSLLEALAQGATVAEALSRPAIPGPVRAFVGCTLGFASGASLPALAAAFCHGREAVIPGMFEPLVRASYDAPLLRYYFERHVELDGGSHGALSDALLAACCGDDEAAWEHAEEAARASLAARQVFWDAVLERLDR